MVQKSGFREPAADESPLIFVLFLFVVVLSGFSPGARGEGTVRSSGGRSNRGNYLIRAAQDRWDEGLCTKWVHTVSSWFTDFVANNSFV